MQDLDWDDRIEYMQLYPVAERDDNGNGGSRNDNSSGGVSDDEKNDKKKFITENEKCRVSGVVLSDHYLGGSH